MNGSGLRIRRKLSSSGAGDLGCKLIGLSGMTAAGQIMFVLALPSISRLFSPAEFGVFTIYLSIVNVLGPLASLKFEASLYGSQSSSKSKIGLALAYLVTLITAALSIAVLLMLEHTGIGGTTVQSNLGMLLPVGIFLGASWSVSTAWLVKTDHIRSLALVQFLQPASMTRRSRSFRPASIIREVFNYRPYS